MGGPGKTVFTSVIICREGFTQTDQLFFLGWSHTLPATSCPHPFQAPLKPLLTVPQRTMRSYKSFASNGF